VRMLLGGATPKWFLALGLALFWVHLSPTVSAQLPGAPRSNLDRVLSTGAFLTGALLQDRDGFIWIGTQGSGLFRYDGYELKPHLAGPDSIADDNVLGLFEDSDGVIWVTTARGLSSYDKRAERYATYAHDPQDPTTISSQAFNLTLQSITEDESRRLWVATRNGLNRFDRATGKFTRYASDSEADSGGLNSGDIFSLLVDSTGVLWVGTGEGLCRLDEEMDRFRCFENDASTTSIGPGSVISLLEGVTGELWVGTDQGLNRLDRRSERFRRYPATTGEVGALHNAYIHAMVQRPDGTLWIGHSLKGGGLTTFDPDSGVFSINAPGERGVGDELKLSSDSVTGFLEDKAGVTWLAHLNGDLDQLDPNRHPIRSYLHDPNDPTTISDRMVNTSYEDSRGTIWFATPNGLNRLDRKTGRFTRYPHDPSDPDAIPGGFVCGPFEDSDDNFWVLSDRNLTLFDREQGKSITSYATFQSPISALEDNRDSNLLWITSWGEGLARFDKHQGTFRYYRHQSGVKETLSNDLLVTLAQDEDGVLWLPTMGGGLDLFDPSAERVVRHYGHDPDDPNSLGSDTATHVFFDSKGRIWVGTYGGGLNRFDPATQTFERFNIENGFVTNSVTNILEDDDGKLWLGTKNGFVRFDPDTRATRVYTTDDGLAGNQFQEAAIAKSRDGTLWVATITGASSFHPRDLKDNPYVPPVVVTSLRQGGEPLSLGVAPERVEEVTLDWRRNYLEFEFAALSYTRSLKNRYKYMLEGLDTEWFDSGDRHFGRYSNLPDGTYTLRIIGSNNDGVWNEQGATLQVTVVPPFWRTLWFRLTALVSGLAALSAVTLGFVLRTKRQRQALERDVAQRKHNERVLRESEERFRSLVANVPGAIYRARWNGARVFEFLSLAFESIAQIPASRMLDRDDQPLRQMIHPDDRDRVLHCIGEALQQRRSFEVEYRLVLADGSERIVLDRGRGCHDSAGKLLWLDGALFDVTERRSLELQLSHAQRIEGVGRLAGGIAHDLNNLLTAVIGNADLIAMDLEPGSPHADGMAQIQVAGDRAMKLTRQLLTFARRSVLQPEVVDLTKLVFNLDKMLRRLIGEDIEFVILPDAEPLPVKVDVSQAEQVLVNLVVNARDAMPEGGRLVIRTMNVPTTVSRPPELRPAVDYVAIQVMDSGVGMSEDAKSRIFEPFFTTKEVGKGTGLGLATCHGIVTQNGGCIVVQSQLGRGSSFYVYLPRTAEEPVSTSAPAAADDVAGGNETILLVEDEALVRTFAARALGDAGYEVLVATDGEDALRVAAAAGHRVDLVVTDVVMPRLSGKELSRRLGERGYAGPTLFMSGYAESSIAEQGVLAPGIELLQKPFLAADIRRRVRRALDRWSAEGGASAKIEPQVPASDADRA